MRIALVTTQSLRGSTVVGRVLPLAKELAVRHDVHVFVHHTVSDPRQPLVKHISIHTVGKDPFTRSAIGKVRLRGVSLVFRMGANALRIFLSMFSVQPDVIVIVKPLPENVLAVWWYAVLRPRVRIVLDVDDFELEAQALTSIWQRAAVHWSERRASRIADAVVAATPFLLDHFEQLARRGTVAMIPTGISDMPLSSLRDARAGNIVLYIGSVSIASGHRVDMLPEILARVRDTIPSVRLVIAGDGDDVEWLREEFERRKVDDAVVWRGRFSAEDVPNILSGVDVLIDPIDSSIENRAKSSFRVVVSCYAGLPIVTSNVGIRSLLLPHVVHSISFADSGDSRSYAECISDLLTSPMTSGDREKMREHGAQFRWSTLAVQYEQLLQSL